MRGRRRPAAVEVAAGERVLAQAESEDGAVAGTREALYVPLPHHDQPRHRRVPWEQVEDAAWDRETGILRVTEVGSWGESRPQHQLVIDDPGRLLELVRERVTASVVLQRHVPIIGRRGVRVIARRSAQGSRDIAWLFEYDEGIDPTDPFVGQAAQEALAAAREEVGQ
jgi:hypothetical protein